MKFALKVACSAFCVVMAVADGEIVAHAQTNSPPVRPDQARPDQPSRPVQPPASGQSTTESLSQSGGVIQPPAIDDPGVKAPPNTNRAPMPEIRPPGAPGGNPNVQPK